MHLKRLAAALVLLPLFYLYVMRLPAVYFFALLALASALAQMEFYSMYDVKGLFKYSGIVLGTCLLLTVYIEGSRPLDMLIVSFIAITALRLFSIKNPAYSLKDISPVIVGLVYIPGLLSYQIILRGKGPEWIIFLYGLIWVSDSFAYYIGKGIGGWKLYKEVSPNKTAAGGIGSLLGGIVSALILNAFVLNSSMPPVTAALIGLIAGSVTIVGDLVESMFKRDAGVKDSGHLIPGHGGILDKMDGALFACPVIFWILTLTGR